uniref:Uncharacterized protein n=1 Tax=Physcomitrium patens TaxID=3218 RepID=A0A2K1LAU0_PHYPA|nr:hypothetical protein PHYPA_001562 [Physcomitrium patens]
MIALLPAPIFQVSIVLQTFVLESHWSRVQYNIFYSYLALGFTTVARCSRVYLSMTSLNALMISEAVVHMDRI